MNFNEMLTAPPMKYWAIPKGNDYDKQIIRNPENFQNYTFTPKMDGEWNKLMFDGTTFWMLSRTLNVQGEYTDRAAKVPHILEELKHLPPYTVLLGELAYADITKTSKDVGSIMRSLVPKALDKQKDEKNKLHFYVFDCLMWAGEDVSQRPYEQRFVNHAALKQFFDFELEYSDRLSPQPITVLPDFLKEYFKRGGEGVVLMDRNAPYAFGKRPARSSVKIKKQLADFEALVIDTLEPNRKYDGTELDTWQYWIERHTPDFNRPEFFSEKQCDGRVRIRSINYSYTPVTKPYWYGWKNGLRCTYEGREFSVTSGLSDEDRAWLATSEARDAIKAGKLYAVCSAMELTADSVRHPYLVRMRDDV